jgi:hypothetical protein
MRRFGGCRWSGCLLVCNPGCQMSLRCPFIFRQVNFRQSIPSPTCAFILLVITMSVQSETGRHPHERIQLAPPLGDRLPLAFLCIHVGHGLLAVLVCFQHFLIDHRYSCLGLMHAQRVLSYDLRASKPAGASFRNY